MPVNPQKRPAEGDAKLALIPQAKKSKNEMIAYTQKDKQLMELVSFQ